MLLVSMWATYDLTLSLPKITGLVLGLNLYLVCARHGRGLRGWMLILAVLLLAGLGIAGLGLLYTQWTAKVPALAEATGRLPTPQAGLPGAEAGVNPNEVAGALLWVLPPLISLAALALTRFARLRRAAGGLGATTLLLSLASAAIVVAGILLLTQSRAGYVAVAGTAAILLGLAMAQRSPRLAIVCGGLAVSVAAALWSGGAIPLDGQPVTAMPSSEPFTDLVSLAQRVEIWGRAIEAVQDFPLTGMGMNVFRRAMHVLYPLTLTAPGVDLAHAHNEFLQVALDLGLPGLVAFVALYIGAFRMLAQVWHATERQDGGDGGQGETLMSFVESAAATRAFVLGLGGGLLAHMLYGLGDAVSLGAKPGFLFWMLLGLVASLHARRCPARAEVTQAEAQASERPPAMPLPERQT